MGRNIAIVAAAAIISAAMLFTFRWEVAVDGGTAVRLDRWTGAIVGCNAPNQMIVNAASLGLPVHLRCSEITQDEIKQGRVELNRQ
jgi:hypothetical protein